MRRLFTTTEMAMTAAIDQLGATAQLLQDDPYARSKILEVRRFLSGRLYFLEGLAVYRADRDSRMAALKRRHTGGDHDDA